MDGDMSAHQRNDNDGKGIILKPNELILSIILSEFSLSPAEAYRRASTPAPNDQ